MICPICGAEEPINETLREWARKYVLPPVEYFYTLDAALEHWGQNFEEVANEQ